MPKQFDVFVNPVRHGGAYPLVVVLQSPFAELADTRIVAPAAPWRSGSWIGVLTPRFSIDSVEYALQIVQLTPMRVTDLKNWVANIAESRDGITAALDRLFHDNA